jgi:hypothetical protein
MLLLLSMQQSRVRPNDRKTTTAKKYELPKSPWDSRDCYITARHLLRQQKAHGFWRGLFIRCRDACSAVG